MKALGLSALAATSGGRWKLQIKGAVKTSMSLGWRDILNRNSYDQVSTLMCIDTLPGGDSLDNAKWRGKGSWPDVFSRCVGWTLVCALLVACSVTKEPDPLPAPPQPGPLGWEVPPPMSAQALLPPDWLKGPHYLVQDEVVNDGAQHHFVVISDFGAFPATGTSMLRTRIVESEAIAALKDARGSEVFASALKFQVLHPFRGVKMLIMEPGRVGRSVGGGLLEFLADARTLSQL